MYRAFDIKIKEGDLCLVGVRVIVNPDAVRTRDAILLTNPDKFYVDDPEYPTTPELRNKALEATRRIIKYKHEVEWTRYFTRYHRGKYY